MSTVSRRSLLAIMGSCASGMLLPRVFGAAAPKLSQPLFVPVPASRTGITWRHTSGRSPNYYLPETTGAGCAFLDYDNDGWMDIYLVNSGACDFYTPKTPLRNALYRNNRDGTFTDVTDKAGVAGGGYGMGVAVGDYDGDGLPDMFVTGYNRSFLYRNNGDGTFTDVTKKAGLNLDGWSTSAVWFDYDNDGRLDLYVCQFVKYNREANKFCGDAVTSERHYCIPSIYPSSRSWLFHNNGDGTFTDVSEASGIAGSLGKGWGVVATDINNDGWMDLFVANDTVENFLFVNDHGKFTEQGLVAGVAYSQDGQTRSGMGVDSADFDQDGWMDLFVTNIDHQMYSLYHNHHDGTFDDMATRTVLGESTREMSGWGLRFFDYDNDGNLDIIIANGHPDDQIALISPTVTYREPLLLFSYDGKTLKDISASAGQVFQKDFAARGLALGDFDNDGAVDVLIAVNNGAPLLLRNEAARGHYWLGVHLIGKTCNRDAIGARVKWVAGSLERHRMKTGGGSFLSSSDPRMVLGLGANPKLDRLEVHWPLPSKRVDVFTKLPVNRYITIEEGRGIVAT
ncbi:MAG TPA: CRTAC1 family protein [Acidobacteriaceae bacterium]|nr:CRTAC1 family protein [Acidobacteriaceae bacterium]